MDTQITLFCPGALAGKFAYAMAALAPECREHLLRLLKRSRPMRGAEQTPSSLPASGAPGRDAPPLELEAPEERWLRNRFGVPAEASVGAYAAVHGARPPEGWIIRPASFHIGLDHLVLLPPHTLELTATESAQLLDASRQWLADEPIRLDALSPTLWQLTELDPARTRFAEMRGASSQRARGRNIDTWLPRGRAARGWRRIANELQMLWHTHPVNQARAERGQDVVNGLWFEGCTRALPVCPYDVIVSRDPVLQGLAHACGARIIDELEPTQLADMLCKTGTDRRHWLIDPGCWQSVPTPGMQSYGADWAEHWAQFSSWLAVLDNPLAFGRGQSLHWVLTGDTRTITLDLSARGLLRFWQDSAPQAWFEHEDPQ